MLSENGSARLLRVDVFLQFDQMKHCTEVEIHLLRHFALYYLQRCMEKGVIDLSFGCLRPHSAGTYDGLALEITDLALVPMVPHASLFHCILQKRTDFVLKLAVVSPAKFMPICVSANLPMPQQLPLRANKAALFEGTNVYCL